MSSNGIIDLDTVNISGMGDPWSRYMAQAAVACLVDQEHKSGVELDVHGIVDSKYELLWNHFEKDLATAWGDHEEAVEYGAYGIACILISLLTGYTHFERSMKGTRFDFWARKSSEGLPFQDSLKLEVSGIARGDNSEVKQRLRIKTEQIGGSTIKNIPGYVVVVEFGTPLSQVVKI